MTMTTIVVIGFTPPQSYAIEMLAQMTATQFDVITVARHSQRGAAIDIAEAVTRHNAQGVVIDIEGAALSADVLHDAVQAAQRLLQRPAVLVTRQVVAAQAVAADQYWLSAPYNREQMTQALQWLKDTIAKTPQSAQPLVAPQSAQQTANLTIPPHTATSKTSSAVSGQPAPDARQREQVFDILARTFADLTQTGLFALAKQLQLLSGYACVTINGQPMYINADEHSAIANRIERMIDHFIVGQALGSDSFDLKPISKDDYQAATAPLLAQGQQKIAISQILWRVGLEILRRGDYTQTHHLRFVAKQMPNFGTTSFVPSYVMPLIASCLGRARSLTDLQGLFGNLTVRQINQVLILLALTGNIQAEPLIVSYQQAASDNVTVQIAPNSTQAASQRDGQNQGIQQASESGFLKRFLGRLGVKF